MKYGSLIAGVIALVLFYIAKTVADTGILGNGYAATIEILLVFLIWIVISCTFLILNAIKESKRLN